MKRACFSCGDPARPKPCETKGCLCPEDPRCGACHAEKFHGAIPDVTGDGILGGNVGGYHPKEPSPWMENNVRLMEGSDG
jgi:hypothetical protein